MAEQIFDSNCNSSDEFNDSESMSSEMFADCSTSKNNETKKSHFVDYGPIRIRVSKKPALTLATGRRSKHLNLEGEEAAKREQRREKNRVAARRLKEKRQTIEEELNEEIKNLEDEQSQLENYLNQLHYKKQQLESELGTNMFKDPLEELLTADEQHNTLLFHQFAQSFHLLEASQSDPLNINEFLLD